MGASRCFFDEPTFWDFQLGASCLWLLFALAIRRVKPVFLRMRALAATGVRGHESGGTTFADGLPVRYRIRNCGAFSSLRRKKTHDFQNDKSSIRLIIICQD